MTHTPTNIHVTRILTLIAILALASPTRAFDASLWQTYTNMNFVTDLAEGDDEIYIATTGGIRRYGRFQDTWLPSLTTIDGLPNNLVERMTYEAHTGDLHIQTPDGTARWMSRLETIVAGGSPEFFDRPAGRIPPDVLMPFGYYVSGGLIRGPRRDYRITDILLDSWNNLWVGTAGLGVGYTDLRFNSIEFLRHGPLEQNVTAIARDDQEVWFGGRDDFGTFARGISRYHTPENRWDYFEEEVVYGLDDAQISSILPHGDNVWFGTDRGILRYRADRDAWITYRFSRWTNRRIGPTTSLVHDDTRLWIGTTTGLAVLDLPVDTLRTVVGSERFEIEGMAAGPATLWAATDRGLFFCPRGEATWAPSDLTTSPVRDVDAQGDTLTVILAEPPSVWVVTHPDSQIITWPLLESGGSRTVDVVRDGFRVWVATDQGVLVIDTRTGKWRNITPADGLVDEDVRSIALEGDRIWFGTRHGVSLYHWSRDPINPDSD